MDKCIQKGILNDKEIQSIQGNKIVEKKDKPFWYTERCPRCFRKVNNKKGYPTGCIYCHTSFLD